MMIQSVWKNLTGLLKAKSQVNTSGVTLKADLEPKINHQTPIYIYIYIYTYIYIYIYIYIYTYNIKYILIT